jgi:hypothetical protein
MLGTATVSRAARRGAVALGAACLIAAATSVTTAQATAPYVAPRSDAGGEESDGFDPVESYDVEEASLPAWERNTGSCCHDWLVPAPDDWVGLAISYFDLGSGLYRRSAVMIGKNGDHVYVSDQRHDGVAAVGFWATIDDDGHIIRRGTCRNRTGYGTVVRCNKDWSEGVLMWMEAGIYEDGSYRQYEASIRYFYNNNE